MYQRSTVGCGFDFARRFLRYTQQQHKSYYCCSHRCRIQSVLYPLTGSVMNILYWSLLDLPRIQPLSIKATCTTDDSVLFSVVK